MRLATFATGLPRIGARTPLASVLHPVSPYSVRPIAREDSCQHTSRPRTATRCNPSPACCDRPTWWCARFCCVSCRSPGRCPSDTGIDWPRDFCGSGRIGVHAPPQYANDGSSRPCGHEPFRARRRASLTGGSASTGSCDNFRYFDPIDPGDGLRGSSWPVRNIWMPPSPEDAGRCSGAAPSRSTQS